MGSNNKIEISFKDIFWNYVGNIFGLGMNILLLPILLKVLTPVDLGLWYVFSSISGLIVLLDFGFAPMISRSVTLAWCGASELNKEGILILDSEDRSTNFLLLKNLLNVSKRIYFWISFVSMLVLTTIGTAYIYSLVFQYNNISYYLLSWIIYVFSIVLNMYYSFWNMFLRGIGALKKLNIATIISRMLFVFLSIIGLLISGGLLAIAVAQIISGLTLRLLCKKEFIKIAGKEFLIDNNYNKNDEKDVLKSLLPNSVKYGIVSIGGFLSQRADILLCSFFLGLQVTSSYGLTMQLFSLLGSMTQLLFSSFSSQITQEKVTGNKKKEISLLSISVVFQFIVGIIGVLFIVFIVPSILSFIGSGSKMLSQYTTMVLGVILLFEWNTSVFLNFLMTSNKIPFVRNSIFSGLFIVVSSFLFIAYTKIGVFSLIIGRAIIGFGFNNWYWPYYVCKEIKISFNRLLIIGVNDIFKKSTNFITKITWRFRNDE